MIPSKTLAMAILCAALPGAARDAAAREYYIGGPVRLHDMEIVANYLVGIEMAPMGPDMVHGADVIHLEADVHATADSEHGFPDGAWIPDLTIEYALAKAGSDWRATGALRPMTAKDGPHYANNVAMNGPGQYRLTYRFVAPEAKGFLRHTDAETGVPAWWAPFTQEFTFTYPQK